MVLASNETAPATCGHVQTGSSKVRIQDTGVSRVLADSGGGIILGPGKPKVLVEGLVISVAGDAIQAHGIGPHAAPTTETTQTKLNIG